MFWIGFAAGFMTCATIVFLCAVSYQVGKKG